MRTDTPTEPDVLVIGSGAGGLAAALFCARSGLSVQVIEKDRAIGGTTAISGGMVWIPDNPLMARHGRPDTPAAAARYLAHLGVPDTPQLQAVLAAGPEAIAALEAGGLVRFRPVLTYPDYYPDLPGATLGGRVLEPLPFDGAALGPWFARLKPPLPAFTLLGGMMVDRADIPHFRRAGRSLPAFLRVARLTLRHARQRLAHPRGTSLVLGNALVARLLAAVLAAGGRVETGVSARALVQADGRVRGVVLEDGRTLRARRAVVLATGGFPHDPARMDLLPPAARGRSAADPGAGGDGLRLGEAAGARVRAGPHGNAFWVPVSLPDGAGAGRPHPHTVTDRGKPGVIAVDRHGRRFANEARSYHQFVEDMLAAEAAGPTLPCHLVCDAHFLWTYGLGTIKPFALSTRAERRTGYLKRGATLAALAAAIGVDPAALQRTVADFNAAAASGADPAFGRGGDAYQRAMGDAAVTPNPCVAPILRPPFYAVALHPGTLGTAAGLAVDPAARVLDAAGRPIPGLYAAGNDAASVMGGRYPGPGITLGPALAFAFLAARAIAAEGPPG
ncbi:FAD-dependent oxidoreductase [Aquabacter spiritensis]|nr:FAD-dependent oxidoreductase [Aquabacter spiritensis]